jgi:LmbE family N-acetylglucosaminyl deacetylase
MYYTLPEVKNPLILSPHPDDEALGCAGTLMLLKSQGISSTIVYLTSGEKLYEESSVHIAQKRIEEARRASSMLCCKDAIFLGYPDGEVTHYSEEIYERLYKIIEKEKPDIVFSPSEIDFHSDHIATAKIALRLFNSSRSFRLAFYEIYATIQFSHLIDITDIVEGKKQIISLYTTSLYENPDVYIHAILGLNAQRSIFTKKKSYYEAFSILDQDVHERGISR